jgi:tetratricopeptide (TPR) repeat protein
LNLPEYIFKASPAEYNPKAKVLVFEFESPDYAPRIGNNAAEFLSQNLLKNHIFEEVLYEPEKFNWTLEQKIKFARQKSCALVILGKVNYYFEGSHVQESKIDEEMKAYDPTTSELTWYAETVTTSRPVTENDMTLITIKGEKAYSGMTLLNVNAFKFCNLFFSKQLNYKEVSADMKLIDMGYRQLMIAKNYDKAQAYFEEALKINPANAYAYLNLGYIHEKRNQIPEAIKLYQKVIELNPQELLTESNVPELIGKPLVELAKHNLNRLQKGTE